MRHWKDNTEHHELKCYPEHFQRIIDGIKHFELRKDDRGFTKGDYLHLREFDPHPDLGYTGREAQVLITHILRDFPGLEKDYVILSIE